MEKNISLIFLIVLLTVSCNPIMSPGIENKFQNKTFIHLFYQDEEECMDSQPPDFFYNCHAQIDFLKNNRVEILLTDIIWIGEYTVEGKEMILIFEPNYEIPEGILIFEIINSSTLRNLKNDTIWKKMKGNSIWR